VSKYGPARYTAAAAPHQIEPQQAILDPSVQMTVLEMASQVGGKTEILLNVIGYHMHWVPTNIVMMYPTIDSAEKFSKKKLTPNCEASPELEKILKPEKSRSSGNTILVKDFAGGSIFLVGANSPPSLRQASGEILLADEIDAYEAEAGDEGDPLELLWKRGESYPTCVKVVSSTPTVDGQSRIDSLMRETDFRKWFVRCPKCGELQTLEWENVHWPKGEPENAWLECAVKHCVLTDQDRLAMYFGGQWMPTQPFRGKRGYFLPGLYCPWGAQRGFKNRLHQMVEDFLRAQKKETTLKVWINTFKCETWKLKAEEVEDKSLLERCEVYETFIPAGCLVLIGSADVQADRIEAEIVGYGEGEECWGIEYRVLMGNPDQPQVWADLEAFWMQAFDHPSGVKLRTAIQVIDMAHKPRQVVKWVKSKQHRRCYAVMGCKTPWAPLVSRPKKSTIRQAIKFDVGGDVAKEIIYGRLKVEEKGPRYCHFPQGRGYDEEYFKQLTAEKLVHHFENGLLVEREWVKKRDRNEALDIRVYALAALEILNPNWTALAKALAIVSPEAKSIANAEQQVPVEQKPQSLPRAKTYNLRRNTSWVSKWK
jgi:phage terminase large subunit GpA-like protein